ncbi:MAG: 3-deoxy-7-phosphoheptulonate synthase [Terriglobales bacterium]
MLLQLDPEAPAAVLTALIQDLLAAGLEPVPVRWLRTPVWRLAAANGHEPDWVGAARLTRGHAGVAGVYSGDYELASRPLRPEGTCVRVASPAGGVEIGGGEFVVIAGPCSVESWEQIRDTALAAASAGAKLLRGGVYKPRTSTYSFQGLGRPGLELLAAAGRQAGLGVVTEVMAPEDVPLVADYADLLQVGARNMQNFPLLKRLGHQRKPVLLKRGAGASIREWLAAAEYLLARGNDQVVLCERGIRTFETYTRNTLDISAVAAAKELAHLPVLVDPSHATGRRSLVASASRAALAAGADGLCLEVHVRPDQSISDREQAISPEMLLGLMSGLRPLAAALGRTL